jgi:2-polyprenyl-3-methyl-5-hydroxy-6-metoxy-1,4-benzoquinol methylase
VTDWRELELHYADLLRKSDREDRRRLFEEAYTVVSAARMATMPDEPAQRTAGTSEALVRSLARLCGPQHRVLEVGCGRGFTCLKLAPHVRCIVGIDVSDAVLNEARELMSSRRVRNVEINKGFADELTRYFPAKSFDRVISIDVYEHLHPEDARIHLAETFTVLRPGGKTIIVTPNRYMGPYDITRELYPEATVPLGFHLNETTHRELLRDLRQVGFTRVRSVRPLDVYLPIKKDFVYPARLNVPLESRAILRGRSFIARCLQLLVHPIFVIARKQ